MKTNEVFKNPNLGKTEDRHSGTEFDSTSFARSCSKLLQQLSSIRQHGSGRWEYGGGLWSTSAATDPMDLLFLRMLFHFHKGVPDHHPKAALLTPLRPHHRWRLLETVQESRFDNFVQRGRSGSTIGTAVGRLSHQKTGNEVLADLVPGVSGYRALVGHQTPTIQRLVDR